MAAQEVHPLVDGRGNWAWEAWEANDSDFAPHLMGTTRGGGRWKFQILRRSSTGSLGKQCCDGFGQRDWTCDRLYGRSTELNVRSSPRAAGDSLARGCRPFVYSVRALS